MLDCKKPYLSILVACLLFIVGCENVDNSQIELAALESLLSSADPHSDQNHQNSSKIEDDGHGEELCDVSGSYEECKFEVGNIEAQCEADCGNNDRPCVIACNEDSMAGFDCCDAHFFP
jgi:hypothetical protein